MLENRISQNTRKSSNINPTQSGSAVNFTAKDAIVVVYKDSLFTRRHLTLLVRTNNVFDKPIREEILRNNESLTLYKSDFKPGLYYIELLDSTKQLLTTKFIVK